MVMIWASHRKAYKGFESQRQHALGGLKRYQTRLGLQERRVRVAPTRVAFSKRQLLGKRIRVGRKTFGFGRGLQRQIYSRKAKVQLRLQKQRQLSALSQARGRLSMELSRVGGLKNPWKRLAGR